MAWFTFFRTEAKLKNLAERLAVACQEQVWGLVRLQALVMGTAEARGYIRGRAGLIVTHAVDAELAQQPEWRSSREDLRDMTTEQVWRLMAVQIRAHRPAPMARRAA